MKVTGFDKITKDREVFKGNQWKNGESVDDSSLPGTWKQEGKKTYANTDLPTVPLSPYLLRFAGS